MHDITSFLTFASSRPANRETILAYKNHLIEQAYAPASVNSMLAALNSFLDFAGYPGAKVKYLRMQKKTYSTAEKELTRAEYLRRLPALNIPMEVLQEAVEILKAACSG